MSPHHSLPPARAGTKSELSVTIRPAALSDVEAITDIYNEAIVTTTATFDMEPKSVAERREWLQSHGERHGGDLLLCQGRVSQSRHRQKTQGGNDRGSAAVTISYTDRARGAGQRREPPPQ